MKTAEEQEEEEEKEKENREILTFVMCVRDVDIVIVMNEQLVVV